MPHLSPIFLGPHILLPTRQEMVLAKRTINHLKTVANVRKTAVKTASCCCLPIACIGFITNAITSGCSFKPTGGFQRDEKGVPYSQFTRCDAGACWRPKPWPQETSDIYDTIYCDACICCICCTHETHNDYLNTQERDQINHARSKFTIFNVAQGLRDKKVPRGVLETILSFAGNPVFVPETQTVISVIEVSV